MSLSPEQLDHLAALARLDLAADEKVKFVAQLSSIIDYVDVLSKAPTAGVEPLEHVAPLANVWREDKLQPCDASVRLEAIKGFPEREGDFLKVKAVFT